VLLSLNRWIRLFANSAVAHLGERIGPHALMIAAAAGSIVSTTLYGLGDGAALQIFARCLWGMSFRRLNLATIAYACERPAPTPASAWVMAALLMGSVQILSLVGGAWLCLNVGSRQVFVIFGAITSIALVAALLLPRLPREPRRLQGFRLPVRTGWRSGASRWALPGDGVFLLTLAFLMKDSITGVAPVMATAMLVALALGGRDYHRPAAGWIGDRFGARQISILNGVGLVLGFAVIAAGHEVIGALLVVTTRGMFNTLVPCW
jgi:MFS family permease